ncbi:aurora protein [Raphidocelis subcapitata]|uniref:Aurora protein n=1 Tax=Raphidocelis subcapitata TaxID=307507 RepID=A0A2V0P8K7_9CHLO|nr:aurora protein [Raphidocelis subcapitata]|eukprot:GBF93487.1 aurora protein [Raphidocelis subcapitata]
MQQQHAAGGVTAAAAAAAISLLPGPAPPAAAGDGSASTKSAASKAELASTLSGGAESSGCLIAAFRGGDEADAAEADGASAAAAAAAAAAQAAAEAAARAAGRPGPCSKLLALCPTVPPLMARDVWCIGDYDVVEKLYTGYASKVYKAVCRRTREVVVLKSYQLSAICELYQHQIFREVALHAALSHENVVAMYAAFQEGDYVILVQEYADGGDLFSLLQKYGGRLSERAAVALVLEPFLRVLQYLHTRGIVHRDIKPENILFSSGMCLKLADFGLAIDLRQERAVTRAGTLDYMAPEVLNCPYKNRPGENKEKAHLYYGNTVDAWAVGVLAYELLVGCPPFYEQSKDRIEARIRGSAPVFPRTMSEDARAFIASALRKDPAARSTVLQLLQHPWVNALRCRRSARQLAAGAGAGAGEAAGAAAGAAAAAAAAAGRAGGGRPAPLTLPEPGGAIAAAAAGRGGGCGISPRTGPIPPHTGAPSPRRAQATAAYAAAAAAVAAARKKVPQSKSPPPPGSAQLPRPGGGVSSKVIGAALTLAAVEALYAPPGHAKGRKPSATSPRRAAPASPVAGAAARSAPPSPPPQPPASPCAAGIQAGAQAAAAPLPQVAAATQQRAPQAPAKSSRLLLLSGDLKPADPKAGELARPHLFGGGPAAPAQRGGTDAAAAEGSPKPRRRWLESLRLWPKSRR